MIFIRLTSFFSLLFVVFMLSHNLDSGLERNATYLYRIWPGQSTGYLGEEDSRNLTITTLPECPAITCMNGGILDDVACQCSCLGDWLGDGCSVCGLVRCRDAKKAVNPLSCQCECPVCPINSSPSSSGQECGCVCNPGYGGIKCDRKFSSIISSSQSISIPSK